MLDRLALPQSAGDKALLQTPEQDSLWVEERLLTPLQALARSAYPRGGYSPVPPPHRTAADQATRHFRRQAAAFGRAPKPLVSALGAGPAGAAVGSPPELLGIAWDEPPNLPEKYFHPTPAAAWAVGQLGQADREDHRCP